MGRSFLQVFHVLFRFSPIYVISLSKALSSRAREWNEKIRKRFRRNEGKFQEGGGWRTGKIAEKSAPKIRLQKILNFEYILKYGAAPRPCVKKGRRDAIWTQLLCKFTSDVDFNYVSRNLSRSRAFVELLPGLQQRKNLRRPVSRSPGLGTYPVV